MKLVINDQEVEYISDYPLGWKISAGDPFKFPIAIGDQHCFVKRFQIKHPENISGWSLLEKLKGKSESHLPKIFDILRVKEKDNEISYVFYEYLEGNTLEQIINKGDSIDLEVLFVDIINALEVIHSYGFWFADFCEKNIFFEKKGRYILLDLDSAQPLSAYPDNDMYGSKDYWIPVYKFYKEVLNQPQIKLQDINGMGLDYLQFVFLLLHLKLFKESKRKNYKSTEDYNLLTTNLKKHDSFPELFLRIYRNGSPVLSPEFVVEIRNLIHEKLISKPMDIKAGASKGAIIHEFKSNTYEVPRGGTFTLSWNAEADKIELYRNGSFFQMLGTSQQTFEKTEFYDSDKDVTYELVAVKNGIQARSKPVVIKCVTSSSTQLPAELLKYVFQSVPWATSVSKIGIITCSLTIIISLIALTDDLDYWQGIVFCLPLLIPLIFLYRFSRKVKPALFNNDKTNFNESFRYLISYSKWIGIVITVYLIILLLALIISLINS